MEITVKTAKKYDYKLTIEKVDHWNEPTKPFQFHGRYIREDGSNIYNGTVKYFATKASALHFYYKKMKSIQV